MLLMKKLLNKLYQAHAQIFKPVSDKDLQMLRMQMAKDKMIPLPADYVQFLMLTDGFMYNGLRFFGVQSHEREEANYAYPSLLDVNKDFYSRGRRNDVLIVGEKDEDLLIYSPAQKTFQIMDKMDLIADMDLPRFFDLVYFFVQKLMDIPQDDQPSSDE